MFERPHTGRFCCMICSMKYFVYIGVFFITAGFVPATVEAAELIDSFDARIVVHENATIEVTERIEYDFGDAERHGIFRSIPFSYQAGTETYTAEVSSVLVTDGTEQPLPFSESRGNGELTLKIGDPDVLVTGSHVYVISYIVKGPFLYFDDFDELYWNVTGFWEKTIAKASVLVDLPRGAQVLSAACYQGEDGSTASCTKDERLVNAEQAGYNARAENLKAQEGFTIAISFPKGSIIEIEKAWRGKGDIPLFAWLVFCIPAFVLLFMVSVWYRHGRDPKGRSSIVTEFSPPEGVSPSLAGIVLTEKTKGKEISAEIVRLAIQGYIKIHRYKKKVLMFSITDYVLERKGNEIPKDTIGAFIFEKLFRERFEGEVDIEGMKVKGTLLSRMQHKFVQEEKEISELMYKEVVEKKYFVGRPDKVRNKYILSGGFVTSIGILGAVIVFLNYPNPDMALWVLASMVLILVVVIFFGNLMPVKTQEGMRIKEYLLGFKRYLEVAEKDRIDFHSSPLQNKAEPERTMEFFDTCLPYAIVFGVEEKWAEKFADIYTEEPSWYNGGAGHAFAAGSFASDLSGFASQVSSASAPQSSGSGGGGSSGGGFGGGGGGSW